MVLSHGDELLFQISSWNFTENAVNFGFPGYPTSVGFTLVSTVTSSPAEFSAILESGDGLTSASLGTSLDFIPGMFEGSLYRGDVSILCGSAQLSETLSGEIFGNSEATLVLLNEGSSTVVGLPPYTEQQSMEVSLEGSGLGVGAIVNRVLLDPPASVPEPGTGVLLMACGIACVASRLIGSRTRR